MQKDYSVTDSRDEDMEWEWEFPHETADRYEKMRCMLQQATANLKRMAT